MATVAGCRLRGSTGTTDKALAKRKASKIEHDAYQSDLDGPQEVITFPQAVTLYLNEYKLNKRSQAYLDRIEDYWKNALVKNITAEKIRESAIVIHPNDSGATRNRQVITPTRSIINYCASLGKCKRVSVKGFEVDAKVKTPVTLEWLNTFIGHARPVIKALVLVMFGTGCRFGEAHRLEWNRDIDMRARTIKIRDTKTNKEREAHMQQPLLIALANLPQEGGKVFDWSESSLRRFWEEDVAKAAEAVPGFERLTFHCCRHGFATKMLRDGIDPKTAAALGGWDDITLFMETYVHASKDATLTDGLFDTPVTQPKCETGQK
jgi:integrase